MIPFAEPPVIIALEEVVLAILPKESWTQLARKASPLFFDALNFILQSLKNVNCWPNFHCNSNKKVWFESLSYHLRILLVHMWFLPWLKSPVVVALSRHCWYIWHCHCHLTLKIPPWRSTSCCWQRPGWRRPSHQGFRGNLQISALGSRADQRRVSWIRIFFRLRKLKTFPSYLPHSVLEFPILVALKRMNVIDIRSSCWCYLTPFLNQPWICKWLRCPSKLRQCQCFQEDLPSRQRFWTRWYLK